ncbi:DUF2017 domain-containing protein [Streptomyces sp. NBC_01387]|uniref:DUF2017 domain-containing protein n=1 Tax=unclassified Streptomyces TaxID=2593676 RepID=UPI002025AF66|nr:MULTISPECIES: DUF2017 domain-containing protein [unclassified Streptomyces]WSC22264.1 DUF2017 domain-containing protein [Streptomyces sp. NBC_01766]WSV56113.1 DUF2017 domain-containing protein [Streptomyces sp. NBC_01014]
MAGPFEAISGGGAAIGLDEVEMSILRSLVVQLLELVGPGQAPVEGEDPLAELFAEGPSEPPADPALARLFPDAYGEKEPDFSSEFRRFTENDLRARKREDALAVVRALDEAGAPADDAAVGRGGSVVVLKLSAEDSRHWLGALNDLRLTIGTRLEVTDEDEDGQLYRLPDDDPRKPMVMAYLWLGALQESLVETLMP